MPHMYVEYTQNLTGLNETQLLQALNAAVCSNPTVTDEADVKTRIHAVQQYAIGKDSHQRGFVHVQLRLLAGRSPEVKKQLSDDIGAVLRAHVPHPAGVMVQLSVEVADMDRGSYYKDRL